MFIVFTVYLAKQGVHVLVPMITLPSVLARYNQLWNAASSPSFGPFQSGPFKIPSGTKYTIAYEEIHALYCSAAVTTVASMVCLTMSKIPWRQGGGGQCCMDMQTLGY